LLIDHGLLNFSCGGIRTQQAGLHDVTGLALYGN
jgi:hypothetical protein